jgi:hypothetical protein
MRPFFILLLTLAATPLFSQKMLLLEKANCAKTTKMYIGEPLHFRLAGSENYWYQRTITDMLPEKSTLLLDNFAVNLGDISQIKVRRKGVWRITGGLTFAFGATLTLATTIAALYGDKDVNYGAYYATAAGSLGVGYFLSTKRKLKLGEKHRLRLVEVKFPAPSQ